MRHWTQDVVPASGVALLASGVPVSLLASVWGGVALSALGVALLAVYRALDFFSALGEVRGLKVRVDAVEEEAARMKVQLDETTKTADTALRAASATRKPTTPGY